MRGRMAEKYDVLQRDLGTETGKNSSLGSHRQQGPKGRVQALGPLGRLTQKQPEQSEAACKAFHKPHADSSMQGRNLTGINPGKEKKISLTKHCTISSSDPGETSRKRGLNLKSHSSRKVWIMCIAKAAPSQKQSEREPPSSQSLADCAAKYTYALHCDSGLQATHASYVKGQRLANRA